MRQLFLGGLLLLVSAWVQALGIATPNGKLLITLPEGFSALNKAEVDQRFGRNPDRPLAVYGNPERRATIAVTWANAAPNRITQSNLDELQEALVSTYEQSIPRLKWGYKGLQSIQQRDWIVLETTVGQGADGLYNLIHFSNQGGNFVGVNFSAPLADKARLMPLFQRSRASMVVQE